MKTKPKPGKPGNRQLEKRFNQVRRKLRQETEMLNYLRGKHWPALYKAAKRVTGANGGAAALKACSRVVNSEAALYQRQQQYDRLCREEKKVRTQLGQ